MKTICVYNKLREVVDKGERIITRNLTLPILNNFLLIAEDNNLKVSSTNLEIGVTSKFPCKVIENGEITIPAKVFQGIISNLETDKVQIETKKENNLTITTESYKGELKGESARDFPIIPKLKRSLEISFNAQELAKALGQVISFSAFSETRPEITGVLFSKVKKQDFMSLVSTDSFRLAERKVFLTKKDKETEFSFILPQKTSSEILRVLEGEKEIVCVVDKNQIAFELANYNLTSRLIEGNYPDYSSLIPKDFKTEVVVVKEDLTKAIKLVSLLSSRVNDLKLIIKKEKNVTVYARDPDLGENSTTLAADIKGEPLEISFNWHYLLEGIQHVDGKKISLRLNDNTKPVLIRSLQEANFVYVVMPIRS